MKTPPMKTATASSTTTASPTTLAATRTTRLPGRTAASRKTSAGCRRRPGTSWRRGGRRKIRGRGLPSIQGHMTPSVDLQTWSSMINQISRNKELLLWKASGNLHLKRMDDILLFSPNSVDWFYFENPQLNMCDISMSFIVIGQKLTIRKWTYLIHDLAHFFPNIWRLLLLTVVSW